MNRKKKLTNIENLLTIVSIKEGFIIWTSAIKINKKYIYRGYNYRGYMRYSFVVPS